MTQCPTFVRSAEPLLASALVTDGEVAAWLDEVGRGVTGAKAGETAEQGVVRTGSGSVDLAMGGGLQGGRVLGVWGEGGGAGEVSEWFRWG